MGLAASAPDRDFSNRESKLVMQASSADVRVLLNFFVVFLGGHLDLFKVPLANMKLVIRITSDSRGAPGKTLRNRRCFGDLSRRTI